MLTSYSVKAHYTCEIVMKVIKLPGLTKEIADNVSSGKVHGCDPCHVRWRRRGAAVVEGRATRGGVTGGVTHAMSGGGGEVQQ